MVHCGWQGHDMGRNRRHAPLHQPPSLQARFPYIAPSPDRRAPLQIAWHAQAPLHPQPGPLQHTSPHLHLSYPILPWKATTALNRSLN